MRKQDTAALNTHALVARVEELGIKQYWLARKLDVTTRTVNRWMTGKVKRLSRENLDRMVEVLKTTHEELTTPDEGDVFATRSEQTKAAHLLVMRETENLFHASQQYAAYEQLLKATLHPDLTLHQLAVMYNQLLIVNAMQHKFDDARIMAERAIDCAQRCGDLPHEMSARTSLAVIDAEQGMLGEARKKLELLVDLQESVGAPQRFRINNTHNLSSAYRLMGEMKKAADLSNPAIEYYARHGRKDFCASAYQNAGLLARDVAQYSHALGFIEISCAIANLDQFQREQTEFEIYRLELHSLLGDQSVTALLPPLLNRIRGFSYLGDNVWGSIAGTYRRAGDLALAEEVAAEGLTRPSTRRYERPLLQQERARIAVARGDDKLARKLLDEANAGFKACGMLKRVTDDPEPEIGIPFKRTGARIKLLKLPNFHLEKRPAATSQS